MTKQPKYIYPVECLFRFDYEQGWMSREDAEAFERDHLARCAACREDLAFFESVWARRRAHPEILEGAEAPAQAGKRRRIVLWILGVGLVVAAAAWLFRLV